MQGEEFWTLLRRDSAERLGIQRGSGRGFPECNNSGQTEGGLQRAAEAEVVIWRLIYISTGESYPIQRGDF